MFRAFITGIIEFRSDFTTHFDNIEAYDLGRELAHLITFRKFETN